MKPLAGPPAPARLVVDARTQLEDALDPVDVVAAALALIDLQAPIPPMGGGFAVGGRAVEYAGHVVAALDMRGLLVRQGRLL